MRLSKKWSLEKKIKCQENRTEEEKMSLQPKHSYR